MTSGITAVVPAAGSGSRFGGKVPKQYLQIAGRSVLEHSIEALLTSDRVTRVIVPISPDDSWWPTLPIASHPAVVTCPGGRERADSVLAALNVAADWLQDDDWVLVHDAVRPCVAAADIERLMTRVVDDPCGGLLAVPSRDTLKKAVAGRAASTIDRREIWQAQTPQMFRNGALRNALRHAINNAAEVTDEASALEQAGHAPILVEGRHDNIKITFAEDLAIAEAVINRRKHDNE